MTKNTKITIVGVVALLLIIVVYASYALLTTTSNINNLDISADINGPLKFDATGGTSFKLDVDVSQMDSSKVGNVVASADDIMTVTLETDGMEGICCSYDFIWEWDETDTERNQYHLSEGGIDEYVLSGSLSETYLLNGNSTSISHTNPVFKLQVPNYDGQKLSNSVHRTSICNNTKELTTKATQTYSLNASFYNLNVAQDNLRGAQLSSKIKIDNVVCKKQVTLSEEVLAQVQEKDHSSSQDGSVYKVAEETVTYNGEILDAGIRYEGLDPDNYVTFNGEDAGWRIIGVFEGSTIGLEPGKYYTKIIRNTRIGSYAWDNWNDINDDGVVSSNESDNDWITSTLNTYLNGTYLSSMNDSNKIAKYNGNYSTWHLRGTSNYTNLYSQEWYVTERYTGQAGYRNGKQYAADIETTGAIGIMYPSDYGYAAYGSSCDNNSSMTLYNYKGGCASVDWLATDSINNGDIEWLMSLYPNAFNGGIDVHGSTGGGIGSSSTAFENAVRPTLYLEHDVVIAGGTGSKNDPYTLDYKVPTLSEEVLAKVSDSDYTSSQDGTVYKVAKEEVTYQNKTYDAGVRYEGLDPDNYLTFNGEEAGWRIIGVFEGSTIGLEPGKQYTKIIRANSIGEYIWDGTDLNSDGDYFDTGEIGENDWTNSTLNTYLNGTYLSSMTDSGKIAKYNENYSTWYLRGMSMGTYQKYYSQDLYIVERITGQAGYRNGTQYAADSEVPGAIGLMYPSDYGFAAYGTSCDNRTSFTVSNYTNGCGAVDWLFSNGISELFITPDFELSSRVYSSSGSLVGNGVSSTANVRPTLYLESDVVITGGNGSKTKPYIIE